MAAVPGANEIQQVARTLGFEIAASEVEIYQQCLTDQLQTLDEFMQTRLEESRPPLQAAHRDLGRRPGPHEDPLNAWLWKCSFRGTDEGLLADKTVAFKDTIAVAGMPLTLGSDAMEGYIPDFDATVVTRTLQEGGTVVGKNALAGGFGEANDHCRPMNPHAPDRLTGGTSAGSAVAVVTGEADITFGGDQAGSVRIPAAWCGAVGLKPTFGLISHFGVGFGVATEQSIDHVGPIARTVEDVASALQAVAGYDGLDPRQDRYIPERVDALTNLTSGVDGLTIGILDEGFIDAEPDVARLVKASTDLLRDAGAKITTVSIPEHTRATTAHTALSTEGAHALRKTSPVGMFTKTHYPASFISAVNKAWATQHDLHPQTKLLQLIGTFSRRIYDGRLYAKAQNVRPAFVHAYDEALREVDVIAMPTCLLKAPTYEPPNRDAQTLKDVLLPDTHPAATKSLMQAIRNTIPFNYTGHPALAMPCGKSKGLPVSLQLVGRFLDESTLLRAGYALQQALPYDEIIVVD